MKSRSNPHRASYKVMFNVIAISACFLLNVLWSFSFMVMMTSPATQSGYSSALFGKVYLWLLGMPLSIWTSSVSFSFRIFWALHTLHFLPWGITIPSPLHLLHWDVVCVYIPGPIWIILVTLPFPLQSLHLVAPSPPNPLHSLHRTYRSILSFFVLPKNISSKVTAIS